MSEGEQAIIVGLLAEQDVIWRPVRDGGSLATNVHGERQEFLRAGVPWMSQGLTVAERKTAERDLKRLESRGLVKVSKPRNRTQRASLSSAAEWRARAIVNVSGPGLMREAMKEVAAFSKAEPVLLTDAWVAETKVARHEWGHPDTTPFRDFQELLLPALARRFVECRCTCHGHAYYYLTKLGRAYLTNAAAEPEVAAEVDPDAEDEYWERRHMRLERLMSEGDSRDIGSLPLPIAVTGLPVWMGGQSCLFPEELPIATLEVRREWLTDEVRAGTGLFERPAGRGDLLGRAAELVGEPGALADGAAER